MFDDADWKLFTAQTYTEGMVQLSRELIPVVLCECQLPDGKWTDVLSQVARRSMLNQRDIGAWCGIFATYCYRASGLIIRWDDVKLQSPQYFDTLGANAAVQKGDIGVFDPKINHHFVVIQDAAPGSKVFSIDGNVGNPAEATVSPWNSVISKRFYLRATLAGKAGRFLRPKFGAMGKP